jgi:predicted tellurium resistance membrane protein TerC
VMDKCHYLKVGLALVLVFVGVKMTMTDIYRVPVAISLAVIALLLAGSVALSLLRPPTPAPVLARLEPESRSVPLVEESTGTKP